MQLLKKKSFIYVVTMHYYIYTIMKHKANSFYGLY